jgi:hypothetical protein
MHVLVYTKIMRRKNFKAAIYYISCKVIHDNYGIFAFRSKWGQEETFRI